VKGAWPSPRPAKTPVPAGYAPAATGGRPRLVAHDHHGAEVDPELANRLVVLGVDEDRAQTRAVQAAQRRGATLEGLVARLGRESVIRLHRNAQRLLEALPSLSPAPKSWPSPTRPPTTARPSKAPVGRRLDALLHQHQRPQGTVDVAGAPVRYVEASAEDVALGAWLCEEVLVRAPTSCPSGPSAPVGHAEPNERTGWHFAGELQPPGTAGADGLVRAPGTRRPRPPGGPGVRSERRDRPGRRHSYVVAKDERAGPGEGSREVRELSSRGQLPALPGPIADLATFATTRSGRALHVGKEDVGEGPLLELKP